MSQSQGQKLLHRINAFQKAYDDLKEIWDGEYGDLGTWHYPFEQSFDEYNIKIWLDAFTKEVVDRIKELEKLNDNN